MKYIYPDFKSKALTFSYDDNTVEDERLTDLFRKYSLKATFNINTGCFGQHCEFDHFGFMVKYRRMERSQAEKIYRGFEVASHSYEHLIFTDISDEKMHEQEEIDCNEIEKITGTRPIGFAYPCGCYNDNVVRNLRDFGLKYARTIEDTHSFALPKDFLMWHPTCHDHDAELPRLIDEFCGNPDGELPLLYIWGHSFEFQKTDSDRWADMEETCRKLSNNDDIWYADNRSICEYVTAVRETRDMEINQSGIDLYVRVGENNFIWKSGEKKPFEN